MSNEINVHRNRFAGHGEFTFLRCIKHELNSNSKKYFSGAHKLTLSINMFFTLGPNIFCVLWLAVVVFALSISCLHFSICFVSQRNLS